MMPDSQLEDTYKIHSWTLYKVWIDKIQNLYRLRRFVALQNYSNHRLFSFYSGSMLHAMFSSRFDSKPAEDGSYFIDRDGTHFRYILNYLRTGQLVVPEDKIVRRELLNEAEFYRVQGIIDELRSQPFEGSLILSTEHRQILTNWLQAKLTSASFTYTLIYRASRNGWNAVNFHSVCDRKGPTVTVVKSGNNIFGGYTEQSWERKLIHYSK